MSLQAFKSTDTIEAKTTEAIVDSIEFVDAQFDDFLAGCLSAQPMGGAIYDAGADPLVGPLARESYILSFIQIHNLFTRPGTFELYLAVFRAIWGNEVDIEFTIPDPGKLEISIEALSISLDFFMARKIVSNAYVLDEVVDDDLDNIVFQVPNGIKTQQEVDALIRELHPTGVWVQASLNIT